LNKFKHVFKNLDVLKRFREDSNTGIITDIDGTISKIAPTPDEAVIEPLIKYYLIQIVDKFKLVAVVSGRSVKDAKGMLDVEGILYVGNHGLEYYKDGKIFIEPEVKKILPKLKKTINKIEHDKICNIPGILFEDKGLCFSIHYRGCEDSENIKRIILEYLKNFDSESLKITEGRKLVELRPLITFNKGSILEKIVRDNNLKKVIYLGDDITDVDAFNKIKEMVTSNEIDGIAIAVKSDEVPSYVIDSADFWLDSVDEVGRFFQWLAK